MKKVITATLVALAMTGANANGIAQKYGTMSSVDKNSNYKSTMRTVASAIIVGTGAASATALAGATTKTIIFAGTAGSFIGSRKLVARSPEIVSIITKKKQ